MEKNKNKNVEIICRNQLISVIIPARNEENYIEQTLKSIKTQSYKNIEIIVVCNNCKDKTHAIASKYTNKVYDTTLPNVSLNRNYGVRNAEGEIFVFLDADCIADKFLIEKIVYWTRKGYIGGTVKTSPLENKFKHKLIWRLGHITKYIFLTASGIMFCKAGYFPKFRTDLNVAEDTYFILGLKKQGKVKYITDSFIKTSMRRFEKEGYLKTLFKQVFAFFRRKKIAYKEVR
ncbi:glycosyltransferase family 2 protein [Candidatus Woesearchaeota archaeon]|nr:glycosyltransferase family 2 protein [Candidatus Woesearchaeota archaeon]